MLPGYNTNGMAHHRLEEAIDVLAELGYRSVAISIDHGALAPSDPAWEEQLDRVGRRLERRGLRSVIETGARFLLDPRVKHEPTLVSADPAGRARRIEFYRHAIRCAAALGSDCVSLWSGVLRDPVPAELGMARLAEGLRQVLEYADEHSLAIGFEPEPGMLVDTLARFEQLLGLPGAANLRLTLDVGHLHCQGETPIAGQIRRWAGRMVNVHLEDMRRGVHEHLMFGDGEIDFPPIFQALSSIHYPGALHVELSRHSHLAPEAAARAMEFLRRAAGDEWQVDRG